MQRMPFKKFFWLVIFLIASITWSFSSMAGVGVLHQNTLPSHHEKIRAFHFILMKMTLEDARRLVDAVQGAGFNTIVVGIRNGVRLEHAPWKAAEDAWSKEDWIGWVSYARERGLTVIPEIKLLTHQESMLQNRFPQLMFNKNTYDPRNGDVYKVIFPLLDEIIVATNTKIIHIGHDEVAGHNPDSRSRFLGEGEKMLPAELFLDDVLRIHAYLNKKGVSAWMWGDMLISPDEFPSMLRNHLHGTVTGYGKAMRDKLPRDIVICDWHYYDKQESFPSLSIMQQEGFSVVGASWRRLQTTQNFSLYAGQNGAYGMMATSWFVEGTKHNRVVNNWNDLMQIVRESGLIFLRDFPEAKSQQ